jgi:hypothetical protein
MSNSHEIEYQSSYEIEYQEWSLCVSPYQTISYQNIAGYVICPPQQLVSSSKGFSLEFYVGFSCMPTRLNSCIIIP